LKGACYFVDYPDLQVISLDGEQIDEDPQMRLAMGRWLDDVLKNNPKQWVIMTMHYPFYSTKPDRSNPKLKAAFKPWWINTGWILSCRGMTMGMAAECWTRLKTGRSIVEPCT